ncbi:YkvA family protein [Alteromonas sp. CYL-A6]|uniref:YkvA family protein n=1 Tax=Alteromonas nitratireducens TaxID=3390813 RepID=UPI0034AC66DB
MPISISFELSDSDLEHFRDAIKTAAENASKHSDDEILSKAEQAIKDMEQANLPAFVSERLDSLEALIAAVKDEEWQMPDEEKRDILTSLAYFTDPEDMVPDHIPGLGYLDDAIMIELVIQDMSLDLSAYREFCSFRTTEENRRGADAKVDRESWLAGTRSQIRSNLRKKRQSGVRRKVFGRIM